jgi:hypothetical protein
VVRVGTGPETRADPHRRWSLAERASLAKEITVTYVWARREIRRTSVDRATAIARDGREAVIRDDRPGFEYQIALRIARIVERRLSHLPGDTRCLTRSVVLVRMLARRGMDARLVIGAHARPEFTAHAWVELDGHPLLDPLDYQAGRLTEI